MNARDRLFAIPSRRTPGFGLSVGVAACALLSGCVGNPFQDAQVDSRSPIAAEAAKAGRAGGAFPTFASIPNAPKDLPTPKQYGAAAAAVVAAQADLEAKTAPETWTLTATDAFADAARQAAGPEAAPATSNGDTEAFVKELRKRATPPPPPKR